MVSWVLEVANNVKLMFMFAKPFVGADRARRLVRVFLLSLLAGPFYLANVTASLKFQK